jgi:tRNA A-37 threonylcarbamoyl transferase component Bud32
MLSTSNSSLTRSASQQDFKKKKQAEDAWNRARRSDDFDNDLNDLDEFEDNSERRRSLFVSMSNMKSITQRPSYVAEDTKSRRFSQSDTNSKKYARRTDKPQVLLGEINLEEASKDVFNMKQKSNDRTTSVGVFGFGSWRGKKRSTDVLRESRVVDRIEPVTKDWSDTLQLCVDACAAVAFLHEAKVVHGDIKSPNFLIRVNMIYSLSLYIYIYIYIYIESRLRNFTCLNVSQGVLEHSLSVAKSYMGNSIHSKVAQMTGYSQATTATANEAVLIASSKFSSLEVRVLYAHFSFPYTHNCLLSRG